MITANEAKELARKAQEAEYENTLKAIEKQIRDEAESGHNKCKFGVLPDVIVNLLKQDGYKVIISASLGETSVSW